MRVKNVVNAVVTDMGTLVPFVPNNTVVVINMSAAQNTLQSSDSASGPFNTIAVIPALTGVEVVLDKRYLAIEDGAGNFVIIQN